MSVNSFCGECHWEEQFGLEIFLLEHPNHSIVASAKLLLSYIDIHDADSFAKFVAHFHAMKKSVYCKYFRESVPVSRFFSSALIGKELQNQELKMTKPMPTKYLDGVMSLEENSYPETYKTKTVIAHLCCAEC